jgi:hypothetical protein
MNELSVADIGLIIKEVRRHQITFSHLCDDLIDHICCEVEFEMQHGLTFEKAYRKVKEKIGIRGLNKIQEETLYAVDTKYRKMKNTMKITGIAGTVLLGFAALFKILHLPWAGITLVTGAFLLVAFFMPSSMIVLWRESRSRKRLFLFVSAFLAGTLFIVGVLFKTQHWPGSGWIISLAMFSAGLLFLPALLVQKLQDADSRSKKWVYIIGATAAFMYIVFFWMRIMHWPNYLLTGYFLSVLLFIFVIPWYVYLEWKDEKGVNARFIFMVIAVITFLVPSSLISLNLQQNYDDRFFVLARQGEEVLKDHKGANESFLKVYQDSLSFNKMVKVHESTSRVLQRIDAIKTRMMDISGDNHPFDQGSTNALLMPGCESRSELENTLTEYVNEMNDYAGSPSFIPAQNLSDILALLPVRQNDRNKNSLITSLHALNMAETGILMLELNVLECLAHSSDLKE